jgi:nitrogen fixation/metabolism regulation signal transduction histidine kinase
VKKIMEDHGGLVTLDDRPGTVNAENDGTKGAVATLILPETKLALERASGVGVAAKDNDGA